MHTGPFYQWGGRGRLCASRRGARAELPPDVVVVWVGAPATCSSRVERASVNHLPRDRSCRFQCCSLRRGMPSPTPPRLPPARGIGRSRNGCTPLFSLRLALRNDVRGRSSLAQSQHPSPRGGADDGSCSCKRHTHTHTPTHSARASSTSRLISCNAPCNNNNDSAHTHGVALLEGVFVWITIVSPSSGVLPGAPATSGRPGASLRQGPGAYAAPIRYRAWRFGVRSVKLLALSCRRSVHHVHAWPRHSVQLLMMP